MTTPVYDPHADSDPSEGHDRTLEDDAATTMFAGEPEEKNLDEVNARPDRHWYPSDPDETDETDEADETGDEGSDASADDEHSSDEDHESEYDGSEYETYVAASSEVSGLEFAEAADSDAESPRDSEGDRCAERDASAASSFDNLESTSELESMSSFDEFDSSSTSDGMVEIGRLTDGLEGPRAELQEPVGFRAEMAFQDQVYDREQRDRAEQFRAEFLTLARRAQHAYPELAQAEQWTAQEVAGWWREYRMREFKQSVSALGRTEDTDGPLDG